MLLAGDEMGRTQGGNNNALLPGQLGVLAGLGAGRPPSRTCSSSPEALAGLRRDHPVFRRRRFFRGQVPGGEKGDIVWLTPAGGVMTDSDWAASYAKSLAVYLNGDASASPTARRQDH